MTCSACGAIMVPDHQYRQSPPPTGHGVKRHRGRGLCSACHSKARRSGTLLEHDRSTADRDSVLEDVTMLVDLGVRDTAIVADRVSMKRDTLTTALRRAARAGDPRAMEARAMFPWMRS